MLYLVFCRKSPPGIEKFIEVVGRVLLKIYRVKRGRVQYPNGPPRGRVRENSLNVCKS